MLKKIILALFLMTTTAMADYNLIVPQKPSGGTSVWAQIVVAEWEKHLGEKINLIYKPGARDQLGPNEFQNELRFTHQLNWFFSNGFFSTSCHTSAICSSVINVGAWPIRPAYALLP